MKYNIRDYLKKLWDFLWNDDSLLSWLVNIVLAFVLIKFIVYPGLGLLLSTSHPVVAVVSESMEHTGGFDDWWIKNKEWYEENEIIKGEFEKFRFKNGFNKGDIMVLKGKNVRDIDVGETIVFQSGKPDPIIHRVVKKREENGELFFQTKGDNNPRSLENGLIDETNIKEEQIIGTALVRIPLLGYIKIGFVEAICFDPIQSLLKPLFKNLSCNR